MLGLKKCLYVSCTEKQRSSEETTQGWKRRRAPCHPVECESPGGKTSSRKLGRAGSWREWSQWRMDTVGSAQVERHFWGRTHALGSEKSRSLPRWIELPCKVKFGKCFGVFWYKICGHQQSQYISSCSNARAKCGFYELIHVRASPKYQDICLAVRKPREELLCPPCAGHTSLLWFPCANTHIPQCYPFISLAELQQGGFIWD